MDGKYLTDIMQQELILKMHQERSPWLGQEL